MCSPRLVRKASSSVVRSRTVRSSVATARPRRGSCASVSARACTPASVSRRRAATSAASGAVSGPLLGVCPRDPNPNQASAPMRPIPAMSGLRRLPTWKPELVRSQPRSGTARDVEVEGVLALFDFDRLGHWLGAVLGPGAQLVLAGREALELVAPARL